MWMTVVTRHETNNIKFLKYLFFDTVQRNPELCIEDSWIIRRVCIWNKRTATFVVAGSFETYNLFGERVFLHDPVVRFSCALLAVSASSLRGEWPAKRSEAQTAERGNNDWIESLQQNYTAAHKLITLTVLFVIPVLWHFTFDSRRT